MRPPSWLWDHFHKGNKANSTQHKGFCNYHTNHHLKILQKFYSWEIPRRKNRIKWRPKSCRILRTSKAICGIARQRMGLLDVVLNATSGMLNQRAKVHIEAKSKTKKSYARQRIQLCQVTRQAARARTITTTKLKVHARAAADADSDDEDTGEMVETSSSIRPTRNVGYPVYGIRVQLLTIVWLQVQIFFGQKYPITIADLFNWSVEAGWNLFWDVRRRHYNEEMLFYELCTESDTVTRQRADWDWWHQLMGYFCFYIFNYNNLAVLTHLTLLTLGLFGSFEFWIDPNGPKR